MIVGALSNAADVRTAYFNLVATQAAVEAARAAVRTMDEAQRVTARYAAEETVLRAEALEVDARLAKSLYELSVAENGLTTQREHLNEWGCITFDYPNRLLR